MKTNPFHPDQIAKTVTSGLIHTEKGGFEPEMFQSWFTIQYWPISDYSCEIKESTLAMTHFSGFTIIFPIL